MPWAIRSTSEPSPGVSPANIAEKWSIPTAVTNGSAHGSSIRAARLAIARDAATAVAVAPTPDARSHESPSRRPDFGDGILGDDM